MSLYKTRVNGVIGWKSTFGGTNYTGKEAKQNARKEDLVRAQDVIDEAKAIIYDSAYRELEKAISEKTYAQIADDLGVYLNAEFLKVTTDAINYAIQNIDNAFELGTITDDFIQRQLDYVSSVSGFSLVDSVENKVKLAITKIYLLPFEQIGIDSALSLVDLDAIAWTTENTMYWIGSYHDRILQKQLSRVTKEIIVEGLSRSETVTLLRSELGATMSQSSHYWSSMGNHITTTSRMFGTLSSYQTAGIEVYEIRAIMDERTSPECRFLNGKKFKTSEGIELRDQMMAAETPEEALLIKPWFNVDQLKKFKHLPVSTSFPPYHFGCRTSIVYIQTA